MGDFFLEAEIEDQVIEEQLFFLVVANYSTPCCNINIS